jgi:hypothetical protein
MLIYQLIKIQGRCNIIIITTTITATTNRFEVFTEVMIYILLVLAIVPCSLEGEYYHVGGNHCPFLQCKTTPVDRGIVFLRNTSNHL